MQTRVKLVLAGLASALLLALSISASANNLSASNGRIRVVWSTLVLASTSEGIPRVTCPVTLEGSFHSATIRKVAGALVGLVSRASVVPASCTGGTVTIGQEALPWHARYQAFSGTLPNITGVTIATVGARWRFTVEGITCGATSTTASPGVGILNVSGGRVTSLTAETSSNIPFEGSVFCETSIGRAIFTGAGSVSALGTTTAISIRLI
jgi:hypothetical protein